LLDALLWRTSENKQRVMSLTSRASYLTNPWCQV
jgi:hypothetical protein